MSGFSAPPSPLREALARVDCNLRYYAGNYLVPLLAAALYTALMRGLWFVLAALVGGGVGGWLWSLRRPPPALRLWGRPLRRGEGLSGWAAVSLSAAAITGGLPLAAATAAALTRIQSAHTHTH